MTSDLTPQIDASKVHVTLLYGDGHAELATFQAQPRISETLELVARLLPKQVADPQLAAVVVIEGASAQLFSAPTFRWLCGVGPDPTGADPNWMGHPLGKSFMRGAGT